MSNQREVIAVCGCWLYEEKENAFISELVTQCKEQDYVVAAFNFSADPMEGVAEISRETRLLDIIEETECAAVVIMGETISSIPMLHQVSERMQKKGIPVFSLERELPDCINIEMNYGEGFKDMVLHVLRHHKVKRPAMLAGLKGNDFSDLRIKNFREALDECGIEFDEELLKYGDFWDRPSRKAMEEYLQLDELPDAIICANDAMAVTACACIKQAGLRVPEDIIVTGFDGILSGKLNFPAISTVAPDYQVEAALILGTIAAAKRGEEIDTSYTRMVAFKTVPNLSCGCKNPGKTAEEMVNIMSESTTDQKWHMTAMNRLLFEAAEKDSLNDTVSLLSTAVSLWTHIFHFVGVYADYIDAVTDVKPGKECVSVLRVEGGNYCQVGEHYPESELIPGFNKLTMKDSGINMFMIRLLHTHTDVYGYIVEGFENPTAREMRRCEELGMFVSTGLNIVLKNHKLTWLNSKLKEVNKVMEQASTQDYLTGIFNRRGFYDEISDMIKDRMNRGMTLTIFSIDMDGLKIINDNYGHLEGDYAIKTMALAIKNFVARNGICARFGGDEFECAIITDSPLNMDADTVRDRLNGYIKKHSDTNKPYEISGSVGSVSAVIDDNLDVDALMKEADQKMYADKEIRRKAR
ncbi:MAG: diguanylate cyclase [Lachnospiraceae bacterium]|nr:diguanylate cyclase [Lachnospiraceae bacterium]